MHPYQKVPTCYDRSLREFRHSTQLQRVGMLGVLLMELVLSCVEDAEL